MSTLPTPLIPRVNELQQGEWIYLCTQWLDLETTPSPSVVRLARYDSDVVFDGNIYSTFAFEVDEIRQNAKGEIEQIKIVFASPNGLFQDYLEQHNGLKGRRTILTLVHVDHLNDPTAKLEFNYRVISSSFNSQTITLLLSTRLDEVLLQVPNRRFSKIRCMHVYKHEGCWIRSGSSYVQPSGFTASTPGDSTGNTCSKILEDTSNGCAAHTNTTRYGGFPGIGDRGFVVKI